LTNGDLHASRAPDEGEDFSFRGFLIMGAERGDFVSVDQELPSFPQRLQWNVSCRHIRDEIPEAIHVDDLAAPVRLAELFHRRDRQAHHVGDLWPELRRGDATGEPGGDRCEDIATMKRSTHGVAEKALIRDVNHALRGIILQSEREETIVRADEESARGLNEHGPPLGPNARIHDGHVDRPFGESPRALGERERGSPDILRRDQVREIHDRGLTMDGEDHTLHRPDEEIGEAEIRQERDHAAWPHIANSTGTRQNFPS